MPKITRHGGVSNEYDALSEPETAADDAPEPEEAAEAPEKPGRHERARDDAS